MWYQITSYLKFLTKSTNQHSVHSPFVYDLVTKCFYDKTKYPEYSKIFKYKSQLLKNKDRIKVTDLGSGSHILKHNKRTIRDIAKHSGTTTKRAKLLFRLCRYFNFENILELGTSLGIGTHAISHGNPKSSIYTIEGCPNLSQFSKLNFQKENLQNIQSLTGDFDKILQDLNNNSFDFIFFDGNHNKEATLRYFENLLTTTHNDSVFVFDDIYWSKGMTEAWETIKNHPKVTVTIDTFFWGFVFFRKEQQKEHFTIRV